MEDDELRHGSFSPSQTESWNLKLKSRFGDSVNVKNNKKKNDQRIRRIKAKIDPLNGLKDCCVANGSGDRYYKLEFLFNYVSESPD